MITLFLLTLAISAILGLITGEMLATYLTFKLWLYDLNLRMDIQDRRLKNL
jgi:hypothetical protein